MPEGRERFKQTKFVEVVPDALRGKERDTGTRHEKRPPDLPAVDPRRQHDACARCDPEHDLESLNGEVHRPRAPVAVRLDVVTTLVFPAVAVALSWCSFMSAASSL